MRLQIFDDKLVLSHEAAKLVVQIAQAAIADHQRFTFALSGGTTPGTMYSLLTQEPYRSQINWNAVEIFWSDERCVSPADKDSNYRLAKEALLTKVPIPATQIHRMPADLPNRAAACQSYTDEMRQVFKTEGIPAFDLIQLGMGPEAHTASLFPHQPSLHESERLVSEVNVPKPPPERLTFTLPLLNAAHNILFMVTGADKAEAIHEVIEGERKPEEYPAQNVHPDNGEVIWMLDTAAASNLQKRG
ncbi:MAG TPA: 6-phosphogluconolactonase [Ktedonobacteraceae bacterium]|nr:6-phosphogluconolactonase [Ktedonobacteraceae bacterium]